MATEIFREVELYLHLKDKAQKGDVRDDGQLDRFKERIQDRILKAEISHIEEYLVVQRRLAVVKYRLAELRIKLESGDVTPDKLGALKDEIIKYNLELKTQTMNIFNLVHNFEQEQVTLQGYYIRLDMPSDPNRSWWRPMA